MKITAGRSLPSQIANPYLMNEICDATVGKHNVWKNGRSSSTCTAKKKKVRQPVATAAAMRSSDPPMAKKVNHEMDEMFGDVRVDSYYWLRDDSRSDPDVLSYLQQENDYTDFLMSDIVPEATINVLVFVYSDKYPGSNGGFWGLPKGWGPGVYFLLGYLDNFMLLPRTKHLEDQIYAEIRGRIKEDDISAPIRRGPYHYYERTLEGKEYIQHCRCLVSDNGAPPSIYDVLPTGPDAPPEHVILDENVKAQGHAFYSIGAFEVSPNNKLVAYAEDTKGDEIYHVYIIDAETGTCVGKPLVGVKSNIEWAGDDALLYVTMDATLRPEKVSPNNKLVAYAEDTKGDEIYHVYVIDAETGTCLGKPLVGVTSNIEWAGDDALLYVTMDATLRPEKAKPVVEEVKDETTEATDAPADPAPAEQALEVKTEAAEATDVVTMVTIKAVKARQIFDSRGNPTVEVDVICNDGPFARADVPSGASTGVYEALELRDGGSDYLGKGVLKAVNNVNSIIEPALIGKEPTEQTKIDNFMVQELDGTVNEWGCVKIQDIQLFNDHLVVYEREKGLPKVTIYGLPPIGEPLERLQGGQAVDFIDPVYSVDPSESQFSSSILRFFYSSLTTPDSVYDYDMNTGISVLKKIETVLGGFDALNYVTERQWATAPDGTQIPISIVYQRNIVKLDGSDPLLLSGYGSYEYCLDPDFKASRLSLLDRGFIYAIAHIRGGGEMGRQWYEDGKLLKKQNTFTDFIACAEYLIEKSYCAKENLCIEGGSAGGLLIGAALNMRPDLFKVAVAEVPFVDVLTTMLDPTIPLTTSEWEWHYIYWNLIFNLEDWSWRLILKDTRVMYSEPAKFVAKLRDMKTDDNMLLFKCEFGAGHSSKSGRFEKLQEDAFIFAFIMKALNMVPPISSEEAGNEEGEGNTEEQEASNGEEDQVSNVEAEAREENEEVEDKEENEQKEEEDEGTESKEKEENNEERDEEEHNKPMGQHHDSILWLNNASASRI
ncbi:hypothetical protein TEA_005107 [Camellia sinensis var. sinensis]|uniref:Prolyl endopeptidase-like n=1 Tax=Camellia sinensis var. sinensis TaxID=542762 RepID=A0A4S4EYU0_CAMSN|nr:hypothetical protein TEA_005107 [Camellia sinensis var. sinensis]